MARDVGPDQRNRLGTDAAKLFAAPVGKEVADNAMQVLGGWGYCTEYKVERFLRDAKLLEIGGGTLESHQKNLTRDLTRSLGALSRPIWTTAPPGTAPRSRSTATPPATPPGAARAISGSCCCPAVLDPARRAEARPQAARHDRRLPVFLAVAACVSSFLSVIGEAVRTARPLRGARPDLRPLSLSIVSVVFIFWIIQLLLALIVAENPG